MCRYLISFLLLIISQFVFTKELPGVFHLLPQPQKIEVFEINGIKGSDLQYIIGEESAQVPILQPLLNSLPRYVKGNKGIRLILEKNGTPDSEEGYLLDVSKNGVTISSRSNIGLFYGCQTLEQLLEDSRDHAVKIPFMRITDYPSIAYRAVHFDTKHHLDHIEYYYRTIDKLARYKVNAIIWEIEDKLRYTRRSEIAAPNAISKQEMQAISRYAQERNIEISPLVQGLGHAGYILKHHWELRENPSSDWEFCPSDQRTYELQFDLYRDAMEAMPNGRYLHVGGDEITAIGIDERCKAMGKTPFELQMIWLKKVCDFALSHGRTPIFWDDMPLKYANLWWLLHRNVSDEEVLRLWDTSQLDKAIDLFPKSCIYMRWNYDDPTILPHRLLLDWYSKKGLSVMAATAASMGETPFMPRKESRTRYIRDFSRLVVENNLTGILATAWDDGSAHLETVMRGFIAQGEFGWHPQGRTVERFIEAHGYREFGLSKSQCNFIQELEESAFFFDNALIVKGSRNPAWGVSLSFELIDLPNLSDPGKWSIHYKTRLDSARQEEVRYRRIKEDLAVAQKYALRNRFTLEVYEATSHLLHYPTELLLALQIYDIANTSTAREMALQQIQNILAEFQPMRQRLESVYSKSRFMSNPEGYIADMNHHHHLSALSNNSDWMYLYELPMIDKVNQWLQHINKKE